MTKRTKPSSVSRAGVVNSIDAPGTNLEIASLANAPSAISDGSGAIHACSVKHIATGDGQVWKEIEHSCSSLTLRSTY